MLLRSLLVVLTGSLFAPAALPAQSPVRPVLAFGPDLLETTSPIPTTPPARTSGFAPGIALELGVGYLPPGKRWGVELRGLHLARSQRGADGCLNSAADDCTLETRTRVTGLSLSARFSPRSSARWQPYVRGGVGVYQVYHSEPTGVFPGRGGTLVQRDTRTVTTTAAVTGVGLQVGQGRPQLFLEATVLEYLADAPRSRSLLTTLGLRL